MKITSALKKGALPPKKSCSGARVINPLAVMEPPADVRRPVTARVDQTV